MYLVDNNVDFPLTTVTLLEPLIINQVYDDRTQEIIR